MVTSLQILTTVLTSFILFSSSSFAMKFWCYYSDGSYKSIESKAGNWVKLYDNENVQDPQGNRHQITGQEMMEERFGMGLFRGNQRFFKASGYIVNQDDALELGDTCREQAGTRQFKEIRVSKYRYSKSYPAVFIKEDKLMRANNDHLVKPPAAIEDLLSIPLRDIGAPPRVACDVDREDEDAIQPMTGGDLGFAPGQSLLHFIKSPATIPNPDSDFMPRVPNYSAAFHQTLNDPDNVKVRPEGYWKRNRPEGWWVDSVKSYALNPTYNCHQIAEDVRDNMGTGAVKSSGGYGAENRNKALDDAIATIKRGKPAIISLKHTSRSADGHSFSLVLRPDGKVDTLEGWAGTGQTDIATGKKAGLSREDAIKALEDLKLDPTNPENDEVRSAAYRKIAQAYPSSTLYHELGYGNALERYNIPQYDSYEAGMAGRKVSVDEHGATGVFAYLTKDALGRDTKKIRIIKDGRVKKAREVFPERIDANIGIAAKIVDLDSAENIRARLRRNLENQKDLKAHLE